MTRQIHKQTNQASLASVSIICALVVALQCLAPDVNSASVASATVVENDRVLIAIEGMQCENCAKGIRAMLKRTPGVISAEVSFERREAEVEYDSSRTSPEKIVEAITNMGYKANVKKR